MEGWIKSYCDFHNYNSHPTILSSSIKSVFVRFIDKEHKNNGLIEDNTCSKNHIEIKRCGSGKETKLWRKLSLQNYKKRQQKKQEDKTKPRISAVVRTYDIKTQNQRE